MSRSNDPTLDPARRSWVASANDGRTDFPIQNLPFGRFRRAGNGEAWRIGVAIGDQILDLAQAASMGNWSPEVQTLLAPLSVGDLAAVMVQGPQARQVLRLALSDALTEGSLQQSALKDALIAQDQAEMTLPCRIGDYTDFYTGIHHATTVGKLFRPDNPLLPNYKWVPIGYHGRASSIDVSGQQVRRPLGQLKGPNDEMPRLAPSQRLDYEMELGVFIGSPNPLGEPVPMAQAEDAVFGISVLNDWSARDVQAWEYQPLGPFLSKSFASTVSPWVVTLEALAPFRAPYAHPQGDPQPLPYLDSPENRQHGAFDITLEVWLLTKAMQAAGVEPVRLSQSNYRDAYWTVAQMVAHHTINGCNLQPGDLLGTGTQSGATPEQGGSLLELSMGGKQALTLPGGEQRTFLQDGDTVIMRAYCEREGAARIGFGESRGTITPAPSL